MSSVANKALSGFFGAIFNGWACDYLGRKKTLMIATPIAILGGVLQAGATHIAMFLVGRLLGGFAVGKYITPCHNYAVIFITVL